LLRAVTRIEPSVRTARFSRKTPAGNWAIVVSFTACAVEAAAGGMEDAEVAVAVEVDVDVVADDEQAATIEASAIPPTAAIFAGRRIRCVCRWLWVRLSCISGCSFWTGRVHSTTVRRQATRESRRHLDEALGIYDPAVAEMIATCWGISSEARLPCPSTSSSISPLIAH
jgi:hypothetical protein